MMNALSIKLATKANLNILGIKNKIVSKSDEMLVKYDGWFKVFLAVLLALAATIAAGLVIWCVAYKGKKFVGKWHWDIRNYSVMAECK